MTNLEAYFKFRRDSAAFFDASEKEFSDTYDPFHAAGFGVVPDGGGPISITIEDPDARDEDLVRKIEESKAKAWSLLAAKGKAEEAIRDLRERMERAEAALLRLKSANFKFTAILVSVIIVMLFILTRMR